MKAYKYRLYPNQAQRMLIEQHFGCVRHVYNWALAEKTRVYQETGQGLSKRAIQDVGWGSFLNALDYKCRWQGKNLLHIGRFEPSSKRCHACKHVVDKLPLSVRVWKCPVCGIEHDRDINAAKNIREIGLADALTGLVARGLFTQTLFPSAGVAAKGVGFSPRHGSQEAPTIMA